LVEFEDFFSFYYVRWILVESELVTYLKVMIVYFLFE